MRLHNPFEKNETTENVICVRELIVSVLDSRERELSDARITIETDLSRFEALVDKSSLHQAVSALVDHSVASMPIGGQLCVTLLDCDLHWELEFADSSGVDPYQMMTLSQREECSKGRPDRRDASLQTQSTPRPNQKLRIAQNVATEHSGEFQTWNCPQGGTAHVLVIPHRVRLDQKIGAA